MIRSLPRTALLSLAVVMGLRAHAQISLSSAVSLALRNSPKVKMAEADVAKAQAGLDQAKDVYLPSVNVGAGLGNSYGYSTNPPTLFTVTSNSLAYNASQLDYIRAARASVEAAMLSLKDSQEAVAEEAALAFITVAHDVERETVLQQQSEFAGKLVTIVEDRVSAGRDPALDLTAAKLSKAQLRLARMRAEDATADDRDHLARILGVPVASLRLDTGLPPLPSVELADPTTGGELATNSRDPRLSPGVAAAFATAHSKQEVAFGDARYLYRPQLSLFLQYSRYATFADSFKQLQTVFGTIGANNEAYGVQITIPLFDRYHGAKARESAADASKAFHEAENARFLSFDGRSRLRHSIAELEARAEVASLEQQYAGQQLEALLVQLSASNSGNGPLMTPKDEQNSRIAEREKYLSVIDTTFQLRQAQISLLRQTGQLDTWLKSAVTLQGKP